MENNTIKNFFGITGGILSTLFFISPITKCKELIQRKISYKNFPFVMLIFSMLNCILWFTYGLKNKDTIVILTNMSGIVITEIWIIIYYIFYTEIKILKSLLYNLLVILILLILFVLFYSTFNDSSKLGILAMICNILMYAAPGEKIFKVIKTFEYKLLPVLTSYCAFANSFCWFIYGLIKKDFAILIPNGLGLLFAIVQIFVYYYAYNKAKENGINQTVVQIISIASKDDNDNIDNSNDLHVNDNKQNISNENENLEMADLNKNKI